MRLVTSSDLKLNGGPCERSGTDEPTNVEEIANQYSGELNLMTDDKGSSLAIVAVPSFLETFEASMLRA